MKMNEPETFDWLTAMKLFADGVEIEVESIQTWVSVRRDCTNIVFNRDCVYRCKPSPDYTKDQGFKEGDVVAVSDNGAYWSINTYVVFRNGRHFAGHGTWKYARPLTEEEYARVRHEGEALNNNSK
jgi:hypothetical protein